MTAIGGVDVATDETELPRQREPLSRRALLGLGAGMVLTSACGVRPAAGPGVHAVPPENGAANPVKARVPAPTPPPAPQRSVVDTGLLVGFCGAPGSTALGQMTGDLETAGARLTRQARKFPGQRPVVPVVELIATVVHSSPGADGMYRSRARTETVRQYLDQARRMDGVLLLNIQPGRADFLPEVRAYERWLREPDVGVALDPEWAVDRGQLPGEEFGHTTGKELDQVAGYLSSLTQKWNLPPKVMVYHQLTPPVVRHESALREHAGVSIIKVVDGIGSREAKEVTWHQLMKTKPAHVVPGFKLFLSEDTRDGSALMTPRQVMALHPKPAYVVYE